jgi:hypothetical protein
MSRACLLFGVAIVVIGVSGCGSSNFTDILLNQANAAVTTVLDNFITFLVDSVIVAIPDA